MKFLRQYRMIVDRLRALLFPPMIVYQARKRRSRGGKRREKEGKGRTARSLDCEINLDSPRSQWSSAYWKKLFVLQNVTVSQFILMTLSNNHIIIYKYHAWFNLKIFHDYALIWALDYNDKIIYCSNSCTCSACEH